MKLWEKEITGKVENPCMKDIVVLASMAPIAIDQACIDLVKNLEDIGKRHWLERIIESSVEAIIKGKHRS